MTPCCPNCGSAQTLGTEAASICTECATATVAGASISLPLLVAIVIAAGVAVIGLRMLCRRIVGVFHVKRPAVS